MQTGAGGRELQNEPAEREKGHLNEELHVIHAIMINIDKQLFVSKDGACGQLCCSPTRLLHKSRLTSDKICELKKHAPIILKIMSSENAFILEKTQIGMLNPQKQLQFGNFVYRISNV